MHAVIFFLNIDNKKLDASNVCYYNAISNII